MLAIYLTSAFVLLCTAFAIFRIIVRRDYQRRGQLTPLSTVLESLIWGPYFAFPYIYNPPGWAWFWSHRLQAPPILRLIGSISIVAGLAVLVVAMSGLGLLRSLGQEVNVLRQSGLYRFSRNPQIVAGALLVGGYVVLRPSWYALGWLVLYAAMAHMMVLTEEEHLCDVHGEDYVRYCIRVPRYLGFPRGS